MEPTRNEVMAGNLTFSNDGDGEKVVIRVVRKIRIITVRVMPDAPHSETGKKITK